MIDADAISINHYVVITLDYDLVIDAYDIMIDAYDLMIGDEGLIRRD